MPLTDPIALLNQAQNWLETHLSHLLEIGSLMQFGWLGGAILLALVLSRPARRYLNLLEEKIAGRWFDVGFRAIQVILVPLCIWLLLLPYHSMVAEPFKFGHQIIRLFQNLIGAWIIIRFATAFIHYPSLARWVARVIWVVAALNAFGVLDIVLSELDAIGFTLGERRVTVLSILKSAIAFGVMLWVASLLSRLTDTQIQRVHHLTPSLRVLISKVVRTLFIVFAAIIGMNTLGIDLTSLAVFSGAIGVGIGFGLQKVVSNFISGIILLLDRSIKPGDVIAVDGSYGWVNRLSARHVSVITRDGKEHLIPNELLITERVENWSYSDRNIRFRIPVGISYDDDPRKALQLMLEAADETPRILRTPKPNALMLGFGDSAIDLELRVWIDDPANGLGNITSELLLNIWDKFQAHNISIPYPQRDVHIKSGEVPPTS